MFSPASGPRRDGTAGSLREILRPQGPWLFGKIPAHGDFISRGLDHATHVLLDDWLSAVMASGRYQFAKTYRDLPEADLAATAVGTVVSFVVGYVVIVALLRYLNRGSYMPFVIWRITLGLAVLIGLLTGALIA